MADSSLYSLFAVAPYPCLVCDENWVVLYKNQSAVKNLSMIRKSSCLVRKVQDPESLSRLKDGKSTIIMVPEGMHYRRAIGFSYKTDKQTEYIFLFLSRLQLSDGADTASRITDSFASDFFSFFSNYKAVEYQTEDPFAPPPNRLYEDMICRICLYYGDFGQNGICNMADYLQYLKEHVARPLSVLGYRLKIEETEMFLNNCFAFLDQNDFSFLLFRSLYAVLSHSDDGIVTVRADYEEITSSILLTLHTNSRGDDRFDIPITELLPECQLETNLLLPILGKGRFFSFDRENGCLTAKGKLHRFHRSAPYRVQSENTEPSYEALSILAKNLYQLLKQAKNTVS